MSKIVDSAPFKGLQLLRQVLLSPIVSGSLLVAIVAAPESTRLDVLSRLAIPATFNVDIAKRVLQVLFGLGSVRFVNGWLNHIASNSWRVGPARGWDWPGEIAVITGGSSGIGHCVVERLISRQIRVAVVDVQGLPKSLEAHPLVRFYKCDITAPKSVADAAAAIRRDLGHPSILINNAGIASPVSILDISHDFLQKIFNVNCISHWTTVKEFLPQMIKNNKGHVVTVASLASFVALPKAAEYAATKAAALSFHESLTTEIKCFYKADGVLTTVVHPSFVRTPLISDQVGKLESAGMSLLTADQLADEISAQIFSKRGGQVIVPRVLAGLSGLRGWPTWMQELLRDMLGKNAKNV